ncbi:30S ribosomal protein S2 [candidate division WS5 bacterium]|uniref:Small ribosomal subunit protein uS2 n=1 Tax=candidate division WS5 bacterium TaxID=2093353 RepID=A0A419DEB4_9BACT|nr:MAG: 30S ribosomal protein S2 [candidate division WS5 bacterium]
MAELTMQKLFEAGAHFGHQTQRWNPKMAPYIFTEKNKVHIIDLSRTVEKIEEAKKFIESIVADGGKVLFVGTKKQAQGIIKEEAEKCFMPYVSERWLGGMITNFQTIASRTKYLKDLERKLEENSGMTKKEKLKAEEELKKLKANLGGIMDITKVPTALYVVDVTKEMTAVKEAKKMGIPIVAIVDTNVNPGLIDYPIPANDDAVKAIKMITEYIAESIMKTPVKKTEEELKADKNTKAKADKIPEAELEKAEEIEEKDLEKEKIRAKKEEKEKE